VNGFSNEEEELVKLSTVVPFLLEDQLKARGGQYEQSAAWQPHVTVDQRLITGQNPQSAKAVGEAIKKALD
jgi:putative intracellular protease/amidase